MTYYISFVLGSAIGTVLFHYPFYLITKRLTKSTHLATYWAVAAVVLIGGIVSGIGDGEGSFADRLGNIRPEYIIQQFPGAFVALGTLLHFRLRETNKEESN